MDKKTYSLVAIILILGVLSISQLWFILTTKIHLQQQIELNQKTLTQIQTNLANQDNHWYTVEANYLIKLADIQLRTQHDVSTAIYLLQRAQQILQHSTDLKSQTAAQALAAPLDTLKQIKPISLININQQLIKLQRQISQLTLTTITNVLPNEARPTTINEKTGWHAWLAKIGTKLKALIILRNNDNIVMPLISRDAQTRTEQHLFALLTQTQWAAWQAQGNSYQENLRQLEWLIEHHYCLDNQTKKVLTMIRELQKIEVAPVLPDLSHSLLQE